MYARVVGRMGLVLGCASCMTYVGAAPASLEPGSDVRLMLTPAGGAGLSGVIGPNAAAIEGTVRRRDSAGVQVSVREVIRTDSSSTVWRGGWVLVPQDAVATAEVRRLAPARSVFLAGAMVLGSALVAQSGRGSATAPTVAGSPVGTR